VARFLFRETNPTAIRQQGSSTKTFRIPYLRTETAYMEKMNWAMKTLVDIAIFIVGSWVGYQAGKNKVVRELTPRERIINQMNEHKGE
jgi:hypothetical protein